MSRVCLPAAVVVLLIGVAAPASAGPPAATTSPASSIGSTTATLNGSGNPNGEATTGWFRFGFASPGTCNDTFGTRAPASGGAALGAGFSPVSYSQGIVGLIPGASYYYCAIVQNSSGTVVRRAADVLHRDRRADRHHLRRVVDHRDHGDAQRQRQPQRRCDHRLVPL